MGRAWDLLALAEGPLLELPEVPVVKERKRGREEGDMVMVVAARRSLVMIAQLLYAGGCGGRDAYYELLEAKDVKGKVCCWRVARGCRSVSRTLEIARHRGKRLEGHYLN